MLSFQSSFQLKTFKLLCRLQFTFYKHEFLVIPNYKMLPSQEKKIPKPQLLFLPQKHFRIWGVLSFLFVCF